MYKVNPFPQQRRHTYYFLRDAKKSMPIYINMDIDMSNIIKHRNQHKGNKLSYLSYFIYVISRTLKKYPQANTAIFDSINPKIVYYDTVSAKFTLDKEINGCRAVVSAVVESSNLASLKYIQEVIDHYKYKSFDEIEQFKPLKKLQKLPMIIGNWFYQIMLSNLKRKEYLQGTFCITSLGGAPVRDFYPMVTSTLTFGYGQFVDKVKVIRDEIQIKPILCLNMVFDHRLLDGALASEILYTIKSELENFADT